MNPSPTTEDLERETQEFFRRHWNERALPGPPPVWREVPAHFPGSVPYHDLGGCYALIEGNAVVYVGLGASQGGGIYQEHGISRRLLQHVIRPVGGGNHAPQEKWQTITAIRTIGFEKPLTYLAPALEDYLIGKLAPRENTNKVHPRTAG